MQRLFAAAQHDSNAHQALKPTPLSAAFVPCRGIGVTIVCPGPVAPPVGEASTRSLYGPKGAIQRQEVLDPKRMPASRAAVLIANAMAAGVSECWLARQPVLLMGELLA
jgi:hypothetical protein